MRNKVNDFSTGQINQSFLFIGKGKGENRETFIMSFSG